MKAQGAGAAGSTSRNSILPRSRRTAGRLLPEPPRRGRAGNSPLSPILSLAIAALEKIHFWRGDPPDWIQWPSRAADWIACLSCVTVREEELLVERLAPRASSAPRAGVRVASATGTEDGDEGEQGGEGERVEELLRTDRQWKACDRSYQRNPTPARQAPTPHRTNQSSRALSRTYTPRCSPDLVRDSRTRIGFSR